MLTFITRSCWQRLAKPFPSVPSAHCLGTACAGVLPTYWLPTWEWGEPSTLNKKMRDNSGQLFGKLSVPGPTSPVMPMRGHPAGAGPVCWSLEKAGEVSTSLPAGSRSEDTYTPLGRWKAALGYSRSQGSDQVSAHGLLWGDAASMGPELRSSVPCDAPGCSRAMPS